MLNMAGAFPTKEPSAKISALESSTSMLTKPRLASVSAALSEFLRAAARFVATMVVSDFLTGWFCRTAGMMMSGAHFREALFLVWVLIRVGRSGLPRGLGRPFA